jgi:hypothetical protein
VAEKGLPAEEVEFLRKAGMTEGQIAAVTRKMTAELQLPYVHSFLDPTYDPIRLGGWVSAIISDSMGAFRALLKYGR